LSRSFPSLMGGEYNGERERAPAGSAFFLRTAT
jgi:hypothetical protein